MATSCVKAPSPLAKMTISLNSKWQSRGDNIKTIIHYYADPAQPNIGAVRVVDLL